MREMQHAAKQNDDAVTIKEHVYSTSHIQARVDMLLLEEMRQKQLIGDCFNHLTS